MTESSTSKTHTAKGEAIPHTPDRQSLQALIDASAAINADLEFDTVLDRIAEHAAQVLRAEGSSVLLYDPERQQLVFHAAVGPAGRMLRGERIDAGTGIAGQVARTRRGVRVDDVRQNSNFFPGIDRMTNTQTRSLLAAPLLAQDEVLGVVEVINPIERQRFGEDDLSLLRIFANLAAASARNARNFHRVSKEAQGHRSARPPATIIGQSKSFREAIALCHKVAPFHSTVLITGETGTGKEVAARAIHDHSPRADKPFIALNCAALPETLLESELFGHEKGSFTGATQQRLGRFELADGGTLFLDEVGEISPSIQAKLLRVLQEREFVRVGGAATITCDVRILAATNRDLKQACQRGEFREDLFYRLNVFPICLPPLRKRSDDLPLLVQHFVEEIAPQVGKPAPEVSDEAMTCLMRYPWPGNIRELRNIVERCTLLADDCIGTQHLPNEVVSGQVAPPPAANDEVSEEPAEAAKPIASSAGGESKAARKSSNTLADHERALVQQALEAESWNQSAAARRLGISRDNLRYRMQKYHLSRPAS